MVGRETERREVMKLEEFAKLCGVELPEKLDKRYSDGFRAGHDQAKDEYDNLELDLSKTVDEEKVKKSVLYDIELLRGLPNVSDEQLADDIAHDITTNINKLLKGGE